MYGSALNLSSKACVSRLVLERARRSKSANNARGPSTPAEFPDASSSPNQKSAADGCNMDDPLLGTSPSFSDSQVKTDKFVAFSKRSAFG